jgi:hypothetical protein
MPINIVRSFLKLDTCFEENRENLCGTLGACGVFPRLPQTLKNTLSKNQYKCGRVLQVHITKVVMVVMICTEQGLIGRGPPEVE